MIWIDDNGVRLVFSSMSHINASPVSERKIDIQRLCVCQRFMQRAGGAELRLHFDIFLSSFVLHVLCFPVLKGL